MQDFLHALGIAEPLKWGFLSVIFTFLAAWAFTHRFIPRVRAFAVQVGWADLPNERRLNKAPLPNAGGLAIFTGFLLPVIVVWMLRPIGLPEVQIQVLAILLGATLMTMMGFIDDQFGLPPLLRMALQFVASLLLIVNGLHVDLSAMTWLPTLPAALLEPLNIAVTLLWIVGITNAFNLLDGVDGLVGGIGFIASMVLLVVAAQFPDRGTAVVLLAGLAGAALGFLRHNFNPSRIIMGDAGAYLFGYTIAAVALLGTLKASVGYSLLGPLLVLALPILDTTQVVLRRLAQGKNPLSHPGKDHLHHKLLARTDARRTAVMMWSLTLGLSPLGMWVQGVNPLVIGVVVVMVIALLALVVFRRVRALRSERVRDQDHLTA
ncbi:undecaprenyl/decaprenyl-phosphate alpha-N-acetylglucosaminyl 1-phosphate transferase (plasmid) [Deinococcus metallilatus]|uniref:UDP-GlcNAc:undecaprenyl-phosphate GlcNAc-1-phosphate transferase n=1 Tax=Deinococcus metallilatus TaxID=1211322 RepID=A0ABR6MV73_9DEIO|nr:MraY family glycosyltransferase [Deinococcus metallilatus]MBB5295834.1 UDP-GlcNAc:undecaprenyl-phosphate GlcNAc-1-phosphate transferase [Deinococcus metallilatus]QBY06740.1 undecaprenyl/decaprenyl-phosphate alpha-N-acetylglucosaminyl 1-phosphate transferase [Deinococcus metallilatus]GMA14360.1 undecaprenyl-phosphate alpha-N-acetylglucosaminyl 1-phosphate transferase [Deinococcus metallilatus]